MDRLSEHKTRVEQLINSIFGELGDFQLAWGPKNNYKQFDFRVFAYKTQQTYYFDINIRDRITPQMAEDLFKNLQQKSLSAPVVRMVYSPVISPRVAEIAARHGISYLDYAGNCRIVNCATGLLISRSGIKNKITSLTTQTTDIFSPKSSRIIRAMLQEPQRAWQVSELAEHPDVGVSVGLVSKIKQVLIQQSYAVERNRRICLKHPLDLLAAWSRNYPGPAGQHQFYMRGETEAVEHNVCIWCKKSRVEFALARFSAAWRLAPEVRYSVASLYVGAEAFGPSMLESLRKVFGAREVDSGANLILLAPYDPSVFVQRASGMERYTSALQTYLDLKSMAGRGSEAADAIFEKHLRVSLESANGKERTAR